MKKHLKCPNCGFVFSAPVMDKRLRHMGGWTPSGLGAVRHPKCKQERSRKLYVVVSDTDLS